MHAVQQGCNSFDLAIYSSMECRYSFEPVLCVVIDTKSKSNSITMHSLNINRVCMIDRIKSSITTNRWWTFSVAFVWKKFRFTWKIGQMIWLKSNRWTDFDWNQYEFLNMVKVNDFQKESEARKKLLEKMKNKKGKKQLNLERYSHDSRTTQFVRIF